MRVIDKQVIKKLTDKEFAKKIIGLKTKDEVKKAFEDEGTIISDKQLDELGENIHEVVKEMSKVPPEELEKIAGGWDWPWSSHATMGDVAGNLASNPAAVTAGGMAIGGAFNLAAAWFTSRKTPPPQPQPVVSDKAIATGAIVVAVLGSGYVITQLAKSGWFNDESPKSTKKKRTSQAVGGE